MALEPPTADAGGDRVIDTTPSTPLAIGVATDGVTTEADNEALDNLCLLRSASPSWMSARSTALRSFTKSLIILALGVDMALGADRDTLVGSDTMGTTAGTLVPGIGIDELT